MHDLLHRNSYMLVATLLATRTAILPTNAKYKRHMRKNPYHLLTWSGLHNPLPTSWLLSDVNAHTAKMKQWVVHVLRRGAIRGAPAGAGASSLRADESIMRWQQHGCTSYGRKLESKLDVGV